MFKSTKKILQFIREAIRSELAGVPAEDHLRVTCGVMEEMLDVVSAQFDTQLKGLKEALREENRRRRIEEKRRRKGAPAEGGASSVPDADSLIFGTGGRSKRARVPVVGDYADNDSSDDVISIHSDEDNWDDDVVERFAGSSSDEDAAARPSKKRKRLKSLKTKQNKGSGGKKKRKQKEERKRPAIVSLSSDSGMSSDSDLGEAPPEDKGAKRNRSPERGPEERSGAAKRPRLEVESDSDSSSEEELPDLPVPAPEAKQPEPPRAAH